jgi:polyhydroxyalkanoate synthesis regulator phasin
MNSNELWFSIFMMIGVIVFAKMIISSVMHALKFHHENRQYWGKTPNGIPPMFQKMTDKAMADRDEVIESLQERVEVLEKIVTDQHNQSKARNLADEIDRLNK